MVEGDMVAGVSPMAAWGRVMVGVARAVVGGAALVSLGVSVFALAWFWPAAQLGQTCDVAHQQWCTPGRGLPQYVTLAVLVGSSVVVAGVSLSGRRRRRLWWLAAGLSVTAFLVAGLEPLAGLPAWWFM